MPGPVTRRVAAALAATFAALALACASLRAETLSPAGFLAALYAQYPLPAGRAPPVLDRPRDWLAGPLLRFVLRDRADVATSGEVGNLDFDPVCACQDDAGLTGASVAVQEADGTTARASVRFTLAGRTRSVRYRLVATPSGWRIADIGTGTVPSLLDFLAKVRR